jgi:glutaredoxin
VAIFSVKRHIAGKINKKWCPHCTRIQHTVYSNRIDYVIASKQSTHYEIAAEISIGTTTINNITHSLIATEGETEDTHL